MPSNQFTIMIQAPTPRQHDNASTVPAEQPIPRTNRVRPYLRAPYSIIRNGFGRLKNVLRYRPGCPCPTCGRQTSRARHDELGQVLLDAPPPPYMIVDPNPPQAPGRRQRQRAAREDRTDATAAVVVAADAGSPTPRTTSTTAPSRTNAIATAVTRPNRTTTSNTSTRTTPAPALPIATIEEETARLYAVRAVITSEERTLQALRRRHAALEHSITNSRMRWNEELERSLTSHQLRLRQLDNVYRTRLPLQHYSSLARQEEMFFGERPRGKV